MTSRTGRDSALDFARALAVIGMVFGHTLHAVLTDEARATGITAFYWRTRALTGPLFLLLAGWVLVLAMQRVADRPLFSKPMVTRLLLLLAVGSVLNWPCGSGEALLIGDQQAWAHLMAFGPLHCVAASTCVALLVMTLLKANRWRLVAFVLLTVAAAVAASRAFVSTAGLGRMLAGGHSQYPLLPWSGFFFAGACIPFLLMARTRARRRTLVLGALALIALSGQIDPLDFEPRDLSNFALRLGLALLIVSATQFVPPFITRPFASIGRQSLWIYAVHLPLVYGFHAWPGLSGTISRTLSGGEGIGAAVIILAFSVTAVFAGLRLFNEVRSLFAGLQSRPGVADPPRA